MPKTLPLALASWSARAGLATQDLTLRLRRAIESGELPAGTSLAPTRDMAGQLDIGRNIVVAAYSQLRALGLVEARGRHGTVVSETRRSGRMPDPAVGAAKADARHGHRPNGLHILRRLRTQPHDDTPGHLNWRLDQASTLALPIEDWRRACREVGRHLPPAGYGDPRGELRLRQAIAQWLLRERGLRVEVRQIIVTQGASQGIAQLAELLLRPGDHCVVENPGYVRAAELFALQGAKVHAVGVDQDGLDIGLAFAGSKPALLHVTAAHHYPLGMALSGRRRQELLRLAWRHGSLILENEYDHEFISTALCHAPLAAVDPERVVLVSTFAKALSPSLRLGYVVAPGAIADRLAQSVDAHRRQVSWPVQLAVTQLLESGALEQHLRRVRRQLDGLRSQLDAQIARLGGRVRILGEHCGQHALLSAESAGASRALHSRLLVAGVKADRIEQFAIGATSVHGLLLSYGHMTQPQMRMAMGVLAKAAASGGAAPGP